MTEEEWLECEDPMSLSVVLLERTLSERKVRWFGAACCRHLKQVAPDWPAAPLVAVLEGLADGRCDGSSVPSRVESAWDNGAYRTWSGPPLWSVEDAVLEAALVPFCESHIELDSGGGAGVIERLPLPAGLEGIVINMRFAFRMANRTGLKGWSEVLVPLLHDIFGNPFRPAAFASEWRTDTVMALAAQMYTSRDFSAMPILADALQDAGCDSDDVLNHCRDPKPVHVRGCWVVDLILGKS